jgi:hypothetical protein
VKILSAHPMESPKYQCETGALLMLDGSQSAPISGLDVNRIPGISPNDGDPLTDQLLDKFQNVAPGGKLEKASALCFWIIAFFYDIAVWNRRN